MDADKHFMRWDFGGFIFEWDDDQLVITACGIDWSEVDEHVDLWDIMESMLCNSEWELVDNRTMPMGLTSDERLYLVEWIEHTDHGDIVDTGRVYTYMESDIRSEVDELRKCNKLTMKCVWRPV